MNITTKTLKNIILALTVLILAVVLYYVIAYSYLTMKAAYTWQCKIYVGEMTAEGRKVCDHYNEGGFWQVLTN